MTLFAVAKINRAIHDGFDLCAVSEFPFAVLDEFSDELRHARGWRESEILIVEMSVRRMLRGTVEKRGDPSVLVSSWLRRLSSSQEKPHRSRKQLTSIQ